MQVIRSSDITAIDGVTKPEEQAETKEIGKQGDSKIERTAIDSPSEVMVNQNYGGCKEQDDESPEDQSMKNSGCAFAVYPALTKHVFPKHTESLPPLSQTMGFSNS